MEGLRILCFFSVLWHAITCVSAVSSDEIEGPDATANLTVLTDPAAVEESNFDGGITTFMFLATSLVQFMTPGLALFYAGMYGNRSAVQLMIQNTTCMSIIFVLWIVVGFSMVFGEPLFSIGGYHILGNPMTYFMWENVGIYYELHRATDVVACCFPGMLFAAFQGMFAVITPALITGGIVDRMRFGPYVIFISIWLLLVYAPLGFWNWGGGWMFQIGSWDFAGGVVVHESAGFAALGAILVLGKRDYPEHIKKPQAHNLPMMLIGTSMLWFGWFGFNGGSALTIGGLATIAFVNTQIAPSVGMTTWILLDWLVKGKPTLVGACTGVIAGCVVITPSAGFVQPQMAIVAGILGTVLSFFCVEATHKYLPDIDDTLDAWGVHGMAGFLGTALVGALADPAECADRETSPGWCANPGTVTRSWEQFGIQTFCALFSAIYSLVATMIILKIMYMYFDILSTYEEQETTRDNQAHGEVSYSLQQKPAASFKAYADEEELVSETLTDHENQS